jgi:hypothetical protein
MARVDEKVAIVKLILQRAQPYKFGRVNGGNALILIISPKPASYQPSLAPSDMGP